MHKALLIALAVLLMEAPAKLDYPPAPKHPVTDTYGAVRVRDDYRWLENAADPEVKQWVAAENALTRNVLDSVPGRAEIGRRIETLLRAPRLEYAGVQLQGGKLFALRSQPPKEQPVLVVFDSISDPKSERVLFDPTAIDTKGGWEVDFYVPSLDAKRVAISLSRHGSEDGSVHVFDTKTGKDFGDVIPRVNYATAGGSVAWNGTGSGFWYTRYPRENERPAADLNFYQQVWFHKLGAPVSEDTYAVGKEFPRIAEITLETSDDGHHVLASVKNGDGGEVEHFLRGADGDWRQITKFDDGVREARFGGDGSLYMLSHAGAPNGRLLRVKPAQPNQPSVVVNTARTLLPPLPDRVARSAKQDQPQNGMAIQDFVVTRNMVYVAMIEGGPSELLTYDRNGKPQGRVPIPPVSSIRELLRAGDDVLFSNSTYTAPKRWYRYHAASKKLGPAALPVKAPVDLSDAAVVREFATSKDGTRIPVNIIFRKGLVRDGSHPTLLLGYGGYALSEQPGMSLTSRLWLDAGGVIARANIRGGGEYGERWHEQGKMLQKQNVFDDFAACAQHLIDRKYTKPSKLAIQGGSNGGLLMGAVMTQHPELMRAVVSHVGIYDMPRTQLTPNGVFNQTEFGAPDNPQQLQAMLAYSPYHHVADGTPYPAALFLTGDHDGRVDPMNSRKFVARLQAATSSSRPILLRTTAGAGHGIGTALSESIASTTDVYAFLWRELDMPPLRQPER